MPPDGPYPGTRIFKTRVFSRWAIREGLSDTALMTAAIEIESGLIDARLGGQIVKKRIGLPGRGKRGGARILAVVHERLRTVFIYGFAKNERDDIDDKSQTALRLLAKELIRLSPVELLKAVRAGELIEMEADDHV